MLGCWLAWPCAGLIPAANTVVTSWVYNDSVMSRRHCFTLVLLNWVLQSALPSSLMERCPTNVPLRVEHSTDTQFLHFDGSTCLTVLSVTYLHDVSKTSFTGSFWDKISQWSSGWPGTYHIDQVGHELTEIHVALLQRAGTKGGYHRVSLVLSAFDLISCLQLLVLNGNVKVFTQYWRPCLPAPVYLTNSIFSGPSAAI